MVNNNLMIFEGHDVEVFELNGQVLFNPKHVAEILEIADVRSSTRNFNDKQLIKVKNSDVHTMHFRKLNNAGENFLTESGVYKLVFKSRKPEAEKFSDWVTDEVLPTIRKHGAYMTEKTLERALESPDFIIQLATKLKNEQEARKVAENKVEELQPLADVAEERIELKGCFSLTDVTKSLDFKRGQITRWAKVCGYLHKTQTEVNKIGERYFKIYSLDRVHNQIGITDEGLQMIKKNKEDIINFSKRKA